MVDIGLLKFDASDFRSPILIQITEKEHRHISNLAKIEVSAVF